MVLLYNNKHTGDVQYMQAIQHNLKHRAFVIVKKKAESFNRKYVL